MDGIGFIGGPRNIGSSSSIGKKANVSKTKTPSMPKDGYIPGQGTGEMGYGPEIGKGFNLPKTEIKDPSADLPKTEIMDPQAQLEHFNKPEQSVTAFEGFFLAGEAEVDNGFGGFGLNGPSSLGGGIVTLKGENINNPRFLIQE